MEGTLFGVRCNGTYLCWMDWLLDFGWEHSEGAINDTRYFIFSVGLVLRICFCGCRDSLEHTMSPS